MAGDDQAAPQPLLDCPSCPGCLARDRVIADQARALERVTSELRWHGLDDDALTVAQAFALYEAAMRGHKSWAKYERWLRPTVRHLGALPCLQLTPEKWTEHRGARLGEKCGRWETIARPSSTTLDMELDLAKMMLRWLVRTGKLPRNPLDMAKRANEPAGRETYLADADVQKLANGADLLKVDGAGHHDERRPLLFRAFVTTKYGYGLRLMEALGLRRDRIGADGLSELSAKKTKGKRRRTIALPTQALEAIRALPDLGDPRIFTHLWNGKVRPVSPCTMRKWFYRVAEATGVDALAFDGERVVPHVLRHSAASHAEAQGAHPSDIQAMLDHASLRTTERYLHRRPAQRALAIAALMERRPAQRASSTDG